jgi:hypothetical protein
VEKSIQVNYIENVKTYGKKFLRGETIHVFRNGCSAISKEITSAELSAYKWKVMKYHISRSRLVRIDLYTFQKKLWQRTRRFFDKIKKE